MPIKTDLAQFESPVIAIFPSRLPDIWIVTADHELYLYNLDDKSKKRLLHLKIPADAAFYCSLDPVQNRFLFGTDQSDALHLVDLDRKKIIRRFELDHQFPTALSFDESGSYIVCGTDQGRVLLWRSDSSTLIARMHSFPDYSASSTIKPKFNFVSAIVFHDNLVATTGYGGSIVITDYQSQAQSHRLHPGHVKNSALLFYKESLIAGNQSGTLLKLSRNTRYPAQRLSTSLGPIGFLFRVGPEPYLLAASEQSRIMLIDAHEMSMIDDRYIELDDPITSLAKDSEDKLYVGTKKGGLYRFDLEPVSTLDALIASKEYAEAYRFSRLEPLLQKSASYKELESIFEKTLQAACLALEKKENDKAKALLEPFASAKPKEIAAVSTAYAQMDRLRYLFQQQKFSPFYGLSDQYPLLRSTSLYAQVEKFWTERFSEAQKLMLLGKPKEAKEVLRLFATVGVKLPFIQLLLQHIDVLKSCSKAIHERDFLTLKQLSQRYPIIRKLPSYLQLIEEAGELEPAIMNALADKSFEHAFLLLDELAEAVQYEEDFIRLKTFATQAHNLYHAITNRHLRSAYHLLDTHPTLSVLPWAKELEEQWNQKLQQCETYAIRGDIAAVRQELGALINLPGRHGRIGDILRTAYQVQLARTVPNDPAAFKKGVVDYCDLFGMDTELRALLKSAQAKGVSLTLDPVLFLPKNRDQWLSNITVLPDRIA